MSAAFWAALPLGPYAAWRRAAGTPHIQLILLSPGCTPLPCTPQPSCRNCQHCFFCCSVQLKNNHSAASRQPPSSPGSLCSYISHFRSIHRGAYFAELRTTTVSTGFWERIQLGWCLRDASPHAAPRLALLRLCIALVLCTCHPPCVPAFPCQLVCRCASCCPSRGASCARCTRPTAPLAACSTT